MSKQRLLNDYLETFEYHGHTLIERIRTIKGVVLRRDWLMFDTVAEAERFFNDIA